MGNIAIRLKVKTCFLLLFFQSTSLARPLISVHDEKNATTGSNVPLPAVFKAPIRPDIVNFVHQNMSKNSRQAYAVNVDAGKKSYDKFLRLRQLEWHFMSRGVTLKMC